jgi:SAM-dependent methyltransferase
MISRSLRPSYLEFRKLVRTQNFLGYSLELVQRLILRIALVFVSAPNLKLRFTYLKLKHEGDLSNISKQYGIRLTTLQRQKEIGFDNPAYRFYRDKPLFCYLASHADTLRGSSWLDVGADKGALSLYLSEMLESRTFELTDVTVPSSGNFPVKQMAGTKLDYECNSFDLVLFSYVLHHAGDDTIQLLRDARRIARNYVFVTEDLRQTEEDCVWAYAHDRWGTFRGRKEWLQLFSVIGFSLIYDKALNSDVHSRHLFILSPNK